MQINNPIGKLTSTRGGAVLLGIAAAVIAAILLVVYVNRYRHSVNSGAANVTVLQAKHFIPKGTSGNNLAATGGYQTLTIAKDQVKTGVITDPAFLTDRVAVTNVNPGEQLTEADFSANLTSAVNTQLKGAQRAVTLSIGATQGSTANVAAGDHVDIYQQLSGPKGTEIKLFRPNVLVIQAPGAAGGNIVLLASSKDVPDFLYASANTTLYMSIRPATQAAATPPTVANAQTMIQFSRPR
jgi:Flp pilus assembly protein CpaB